MRAAIYARKSTLGKKSKADDQTQSVRRQVELATAFIASKGWTLDQAHVYFDDGVSGTIVSRDGIDALRAAAGAKRRAFDCVLVMDLDRLAREQVFAPQMLSWSTTRGSTSGSTRPARSSSTASPNRS